MYVFLGVIPFGGEKALEQNPPKTQGQSREFSVYVFYLRCFFAPLTAEKNLK